MRKIKIGKCGSVNGIVCPMRFTESKEYTNYGECLTDCAWFRIGESNPYTDPSTSAHGRTFAYCGDKLIGELEAAK